MTGTAAYLFVYGTLRQSADHPARRLLEQGAEPVGPGRLQGRLFEVDGYPGAVPSADPANEVIGEIHRLTDPAAVLARLDDYEEASERFPAPREYRRELAQVWLEGGGFITAWVYFYNRSTERLRRISPAEPPRRRERQKSKTILISPDSQLGDAAEV